MNKLQPRFHFHCLIQFLLLGFPSCYQQAFLRPYFTWPVWWSLTSTYLSHSLISDASHFWFTSYHLNNSPFLSLLWVSFVSIYSSVIGILEFPLLLFSDSTFFKISNINSEILDWISDTHFQLLVRYLLDCRNSAFTLSIAAESKQTSVPHF